MTDSDRVRSFAVLGTAVAQAVVGLGSQLVVDADSSTGAISDANRSPVTPAGYAFSIWGLIFLACLVLAVHQLRTDQRDRTVHRRTGWWLVAAFTASTVWVPIFSTGVIWLSQVVILGLVAFLAVAARRFALLGPAPDLAERLTLRLPVTLYLGWATVAAAAGFGTTFRSLGMPERAGWVTAVSVVLVLAAAAVSIVVVGRLLAVGGFALAACWALTAVVVATWSDVVRVTAVVALVVILAVLVIRSVQSRRAAVVLLG